MDYLIQEDKMSVQVSENQIENLRETLGQMEAKTENLTEIHAIIRAQFPEYTFNLWESQTAEDFVTEEGQEEALEQSDDSEMDIAPDTYFFSSEGLAPNKRSTAYAEGYDIQFANQDVVLFLYPNFSNYLSEYRLFTLITTLIITFVLCLMVHFILRSKKVKKQWDKIMRLRVFRRFSFNLMVVNICAGILAISCFFYMYENRYAFFEFMNEVQFNKLNFDSVHEKMQNQVKEYNMDKSSKKELSMILRQNVGEDYEITLYENNGIFYLGNPTQSVNDLFYANDSIYDVSIVRTPDMHMYALTFKNQVATMMIYSYPLVSLVPIYLGVIICFALSLWLIPLLGFIQRKVKAIKHMQEDVSVLSTGDWNHEIAMVGYDEIAQLGKNLNAMRTSFLNNMEKEEEARSANKELITSLSHDLRTPLTALMGYLEIIQYDKCDESQKEEYLKKSLRKVEQISSLSNKMFEYFLIYGEEEKVELVSQSSEEWFSYIEECNSLLIQRGFTIEMSFIDKKDIYIALNMSMMKRVMDNLYSNLIKYADKGSTITLVSEVRENQFRFILSNKKRIGSDDVESNQIGLKSVKKIIEMHQGEIFIQNENEFFMIVLSFPLRSRGSY